ncbi:MAG: bifunctional phosphopantothenoylcysteine decarboxylase/phosphopantothenate--cysteine ligase CoaBC [Wenzhouxiangella sp.]|nr:MAG: bifunctional phosphopantothenoylcysteine decarboxylase/phosphopantothenate--cysteine ligase CoaBC [Wenzhouxiangella sp.]
MSHSSSRRVLLGVSGGIAAYKAPELVRRLRDAGCEVRVVLTAGAQSFVAPLALQAVSGHRVRRDLWDEEAEAGMGHIELARWADDILVAPATAHLIGRLAGGLADDLLTTLILASQARLWLAPAMNRIMWQHPAVQANLASLEARGARLLGPASGSQACGETGPGRMPDPDELVAAITADRALLSGQRILMTAGPTREPLDPVRYLGNRSSGCMAYALAAALRDRGAEVSMVSGPVDLPAPAGVRRFDVETASQMLQAVLDRLDDCNVFIGVAAVADYRPETTAVAKIKKTGQAMHVRLLPNPDILATVAGHARRPELVVGFAAETEAVEAAARSKLEAKNLDLIAANRVGASTGFGDVVSSLEVFSRDRHWTLGPAAKPVLAAELADLLADRITGGTGGGTKT